MLQETRETLLTRNLVLGGINGGVFLLVRKSGTGKVVAAEESGGGDVGDREVITALIIGCKISCDIYEFFYCVYEIVNQNYFMFNSTLNRFEMIKSNF